MSNSEGFNCPSNIMGEIDPYTATSENIKRIFFRENDNISEGDIQKNILNNYISNDILVAMGMIFPTDSYREKTQPEENPSTGGKGFNLFGNNF